MASAGRLVRPFTPTACAQARQLPPLQSARAHTRIHRSRSSRTHARTLRAASAQACPPHARQHAPAARTHAKPRGSARERPAARRPHSGSISERVHVPRPHGRISLATPPPSPRHFCTAGRLNRPTGRLEPEAPPERHRRGGQSRGQQPGCGADLRITRRRIRTTRQPHPRTHVSRRTQLRDRHARPRTRLARTSGAARKSARTTVGRRLPLPAHRRRKASRKSCRPMRHPTHAPTHVTRRAHICSSVARTQAPHVCTHLGRTRARRAHVSRCTHTCASAALSHMCALVAS